MSVSSSAMSENSGTAEEEADPSPPPPSRCDIVNESVVPEHVGLLQISVQPPELVPIVRPTAFKFAKDVTGVPE